MNNVQFGWDDTTIFEASIAKHYADKATAAVETYGEFIATISTAEVVAEVVATPTTAEATATMNNVQFGWDDTTIFEASIAKHYADKATAAVETYGEFIAKLAE